MIPDFLFFDGPEEPEIALDDLKTLEKRNILVEEQDGRDITLRYVFAKDDKTE